MNANEYGSMPGRYPAIVRTYNQARRTCRIEIPGLTDGAEVYPEAEIEYPIGDKARSGQYETELEILPGDTVWISFIGGDPRYPIITGYRNPQTGNSADWRRYHHKNSEVLTDEMMHFDSGVSFHVDAGTDIAETAGESITVKAGQTISTEAGSSISLKAGSSITLTVGGSTIVIAPSSVAITSAAIALNGPITGGGPGGASATFNGDIQVKKGVTSDADVVAGGVSLMHHTHPGDSGGTTGEPN